MLLLFVLRCLFLISLQKKKILGINFMYCLLFSVAFLNIKVDFSCPDYFKMSHAFCCSFENRAKGVVKDTRFIMSCHSQEHDTDVVSCVLMHAAVYRQLYFCNFRSVDEQ